MTQYYITGGGYISISGNDQKCAIVFYSSDGAIRQAEYYRDGLIGGYCIENARAFTFYFGARRSMPERSFGLRIPKPDSITNWELNFFDMYDKTAPEWPNDIEIDVTQTTVTAYAAEIIPDAGEWRDGAIMRRRDKLAWGLCGCKIINMRGCACNTASLLPLPQPIAEEIAQHILL